MPERLELDVLIVGGGQAGIPLAYALVKAGRKVALAESKDLGGSCVNFGCTPTKAAIASAKVAHMARRASDFGLRIPTMEVDFAAVIGRAHGVALESRNGLDRGFEKAGGNPELIRGHARFTGREAGRFLLSVGNREIAASQVVLDTGTRSAIPPIPGLDGVDFLTSENWLDRTELPSHLAILGGGYIGLEMGQFYRLMGSEVSVFDHGDGLRTREDRDVADALHELLAAEGIRFELGAKIQRIEKRGHDIVLTCPGTETVATDLFIATGRTPNTEDLGLETVGVETDSHGIVKVDERLATNVEGVWAAGDIRGGPMFTHTSWDDYRILLSQMAGDRSRTTKRIVPYAVFTDPELGRVGLTEHEAREQEKKFEVHRFEMKRNGKAREIGEAEGFVKVLIEEGSGLILGAAVLSAHGSEIVHLYVDVMNAGAPASVIRDAVHIHPTLAEAIQSAVT